MAEQEKPDNGAAPAAEPRRSLREVAEAAYDEVVELSGDDDGDSGETSQQSVDTGGRQRDEYGRFVKTESGEAAAETPPSPEDETTPVTEPPHPAPETGVAVQAPANWSAEDRAVFEKQTPEGKAFLLRRHSEMEG